MPHIPWSIWDSICDSENVTENNGIYMVSQMSQIHEHIIYTHNKMAIYGSYRTFGKYLGQVGRW
jgi:hypothetical protein